jgi:hypothetical protein
MTEPGHNGTDPYITALAAYGERLQLAYTACKQLATTALMPDTIKVWIDPARAKAGDVSNANLDIEATAIQAAGIMVKAQQLGIPIESALDSMVIIHGRPAPFALTVRGLVLSHGHRLWIDRDSPPTATRAIVHGQRHLGGGEFDEIQTSTWTIDRAAKLGPQGFGNPQGQWKRQPQNMLVARATVEAGRLVAADVLLGIYAVEELSDQGEPEMDTDVTGQPPDGEEPKRRRGRPRQLPPASSSPPPPPEDPGPDMIHDDTRTSLYAGMRDIGVTGRAASIDKINEWLREAADEGHRLAEGEQITAAAELTEARAQYILGRIGVEKMAQPDQPGTAGGEEPGE